MIATVPIIHLPVRKIGPQNPGWVNNALRSYHAKRAGDFNDTTSFGRHWRVMGEIRDKCLPQLPSDARPVHVLDVGIGGSPYPEVFEIKDMLIKAGIKHRVSVMDINRQALSGLMRIKGLSIPPVELSENEVQSAYYDPFLGGTFNREGERLVLSLPNNLLRGTKYYSGDIATSVLPRGHFDLIISMNVFQYLSDKLGQLALFNMANGLKSGGFVIMEGLTELAQQRNRALNVDTMYWFNPARLASLGFRIAYGPLKHNTFGFSVMNYGGIYALQKF